MSLSSYLENYSFEYLMENALNRVPDSLDKREGSIIYDAIAPACYALAEMYMQLKSVIDNTFVTSTYGEFLDARVVEQGLTRYEAIKARKKGTFTFLPNTLESVPIGSRFSAINEDLIYQVIEAYTDESGVVEKGSYVLECETAGTIGNGYAGQILPVTYLQNIATAELSTLLKPGDDIETDDNLRARFIEKVNSRAFGGNVAQYREEARAYGGIGAVQIYPTWNGGGTVKMSILDSEYNIATTDFIKQVQEAFDPSSKANGLGIAPIGHKVTVVTPTEVLINVNAEMTLRPTTDISILKPLVEEAITKYLLEVRQEWDKGNDLNEYTSTVYISQIMVRILQLPGVLNVTNCTINGQSNDITLTQSNMLQQIPKLGTITLT